MRSSRMRGYGSWCTGWREGGRMPSSPSGGPGILFWAFMALVVFSCLKAGGTMGLILGLAVIAGVIKGIQS